MHATQVAHRKRYSSLQNELDSYKEQLSTMKADIEHKAQERKEMDQMISCLREETNRSKESLKRKQELIEFHKQKLETSRAAFNEEINKLKASVRHHSSVSKPTGVVSVFDIRLDLRFFPG